MNLKYLYRIILKILLLPCIMISQISCTKIEREAKVKTTTSGNITLTSAKVVADIIDLGNGITDHGHCWSIEENPTIADFKTTLGPIAKTGQFISELQDLQPGTKYYVRAYVKSGFNVIYGEVDSFETYSLQDIDSNYYHVIVIGSQIWMKENLKTTKYNDGTSIPIVTETSVWSNLTSGAYCWYYNSEEYYGVMYGALYNWYAVNLSKLCPIGWHVPNDSEWIELFEFLGGESIAGGKLKESGTVRWYPPNTAATNQSGFAALPGGQIDAYFHDLLYQGFWWSSTAIYDDFAIATSLYCWSENILIYNSHKTTGYSVRCLKD